MSENLVGRLHGLIVIALALKYIIGEFNYTKSLKTNRVELG